MQRLSLDFQRSDESESNSQDMLRRFEAMGSTQLYRMSTPEDEEAEDATGS